MGQAAFAEVCRQPPNTSQQILHPAKYVGQQEPTATAFPQVAAGKGFRKLSEGMLGEFDHAILVRQYGTTREAGAIAPHWKGGRYSLIENKLQGRVILRYVSEGHSAQIAQAFFRIYVQALHRKWNKMGVAGERETPLSGLSDAARHPLRPSAALSSAA